MPGIESSCRCTPAPRLEPLPGRARQGQPRQRADEPGGNSQQQRHKGYRVVLPLDGVLGSRCGRHGRVKEAPAEEGPTGVEGAGVVLRESQETTLRGSLAAPKPACTSGTSVGAYEGPRCKASRPSSKLAAEKLPPGQHSHDKA